MKTKFKKGDLVLITQKKNYYTNYLAIIVMESFMHFGVWVDAGGSRYGTTRRIFSEDNYHFTVIKKGEFK